MLNGQQILQEGLLKLENTHGKVAQVGYDLSLKSVKKVGFEKDGDKLGMVLKDSTQLTTYHDQNIISLEGKIGFLLYPGTYEFTLNEGCKISPDREGEIIHRSSCSRNGTYIVSAIFDPGFETESMGTIAIVKEPIFIELNARVCQIKFHEVSSVAEEYLYGGEKHDSKWQHDQQRKSDPLFTIIAGMTDEEFLEMERELGHSQAAEIPTDIKEEETPKSRSY